MLRAAKPKYAALICTGIKLDRRAVKSPIDGTGFSVIRSDRRLLPAQHTITVRWELRRQWLDPKNEDRIKAAAILSMEQDRRPNHSATVVLVSSVDPDEVLIRDVHARAMPGMIVDLWPGLRSLTSWTAIPRPVASPLTVQNGRDQAIEDGSTRDSPRVSRSVSSARRHVATRCCSVFPRATRAAVARATEVKHRVTVLVALPSSRRISMRLLSMSSTLGCAISEIRNPSTVGNA